MFLRRSRGHRERCCGPARTLTSPPVIPHLNISQTNPTVASLPAGRTWPTWSSPGDGLRCGRDPHLWDGSYLFDATYIYISIFLNFRIDDHCEMRRDKGS